MRKEEEEKRREEKREKENKQETRAHFQSKNILTQTNFDFNNAAKATYK